MSYLTVVSAGQPPNSRSEYFALSVLFSSTQKSLHGQRRRSLNFFFVVMTRINYVGSWPSTRKIIISKSAGRWKPQDNSSPSRERRQGHPQRWLCTQKLDNVSTYVLTREAVFNATTPLLWGWLSIQVSVRAKKHDGIYNSKSLFISWPELCEWATKSIWV